MTDRDERGRDVTNRLAKRFENEEQDDNEIQDGENTESSGSSKPSKPSQNSQEDQRSKSSQEAQNAQGSEPSQVPQTVENSKSSQLSQDSQNAQTSNSSEPAENSKTEVNVKEEWTGRYMYLPPEVDAMFDNEYDRLVYECGRDLDWKPKKNKHYYPVAVQRGVEAIEKMAADEFLEVVEELGLR